MQGRLSLPSNGKIQSFPKSTWKEEFYKAKEADLSNIEWIFEADEGEKNPITFELGIKEINEVIKETKIVVYSVCADYFLDIPYLTADDQLKKELSEKLTWLILQTKKIGAKYIDLPFVDASKIDSQDQFVEILAFIKPAITIAAKHNIIISLETSLNPEDFKKLLLLINHNNVKANYDTGNSSGIGYNCTEELFAYGNYIKTLHIKDRLLNNGTKPLGTGSADFKSFFKEFNKLRFTGPIIMQAAREEEGKEMETAIKNRIFVEKYLQKNNIK